MGGQCGFDFFDEDGSRDLVLFIHKVRPLYRSVVRRIKLPGSKEFTPSTVIAL